MGQIIGGAAKPKRCNISKLSQLGTPAAGEHILVSSDNSMNAAGQGNFDCYIVGDGTSAATALPLIKTYANDVDNEPTAGSNNLVKSGGVYEKVSQLDQKIDDVAGFPKTIQDTFEMAETGKYIKWQTATIDTLTAGFYSVPIPVKAHCKYVFRSRGYNDVFSMISSCDSEGGNIKQEVRSIDSTVRDYEYTPYYDGYIIVSGYTTTEHTLSHTEGVEGGLINFHSEEIKAINEEVFPVVDYEEYPKGIFGYIGYLGTFYSNNSFTLVTPIPVKRGDIIDYYCRGVNNTVAVISKTDQASTYYQPLVLGIDGDVRHYTYTWDFNDGYIALSASGNSGRQYPRMLTITHISDIDKKIRDSVEGISSEGCLIFVGPNEAYHTITDGCMAASNGDVVIVLPGIYDESVNLSCKDCYESGDTLPDGTTATQRTILENQEHYRSITIIGVDRDKCILRNSTGKYATPALWMTDGCVKNMTILGYAGGSSSIRQNYAVHIDYYNTNDKSLSFENCYIMTECFSCLGCGCKNNFVLSVKNCHLENVSTLQSTTTAMSVHTSAGADMKVELNNNILHSVNSGTVLSFYHNQATTYGGKIKIAAFGNACKSETTGTDCVSITDTSDDGTAITLDTTNWNNQAPALNYSV